MKVKNAFYVGNEPSIFANDTDFKKTPQKAAIELKQIGGILEIKNSEKNKKSMIAAATKRGLKDCFPKKS